MNELVTKLWEQAAQRDDIWQPRHEKFAELIVQESITTLEHRYKWDGDVSDGNEVKKCIAKIKQHFGVE